MRNLTLFVLPFTLLAAACGGDDHEEDIDLEGCEHLAEGPFVAVAATAAADDTAPLVGADHRAYTVTLPALLIGFGGNVRFPVAEAGDHVFFIDRPMTVMFRDASGAAITPEESATSSPACTTIQGKYTVDAPVGTMFIDMSSEITSSVNLVIEHGAHEH
jgi:hypothetical protein